jgi:hypothetical protein
MVTPPPLPRFLETVSIMVAFHVTWLEAFLETQVHGWWRLCAPRWSRCHVCWITRKLVNKIVLKSYVNLRNSHYDMQSRGFNFRTAMRSRISEMWLIRRRIYRIPELYNWSGTKDFKNPEMWLVQNQDASKNLWNKIGQVQNDVKIA